MQRQGERFGALIAVHVVVLAGIAACTSTGTSSPSTPSTATGLPSTSTGTSTATSSPFLVSGDPVPVGSVPAGGGGCKANGSFRGGLVVDIVNAPVQASPLLNNVTASYYFTVNRIAVSIAAGGGVSAQVNGTNGEVWSGADGGGGVWDMRRDRTGGQLKARLDNTQPGGATPLDVDITIRC